MAQVGVVVSPTGRISKEEMNSTASPVLFFRVPRFARIVQRFPSTSAPSPRTSASDRSYASGGNCSRSTSFPSPWSITRDVSTSERLFSLSSIQRGSSRNVTSASIVPLALKNSFLGGRFFASMPTPPVRPWGLTGLSMRHRWRTALGSGPIPRYRAFQSLPRRVGGWLSPLSVPCSSISVVWLSRRSDRPTA